MKPPQKHDELIGTQPFTRIIFSGEEGQRPFRAKLGSARGGEKGVEIRAGSEIPTALVWEEKVEILSAG
jgi:hypothetical protein